MSHGLSHKWQLLIAFMLGNAVNGIAIDYSDYLYYQRLSEGTPLSPLESIWYFTWDVFIIYGAFAVAGYVLGRYTRVRPVVVLYLYLFMIVSSFFLLQTLPNEYIRSAAFQGSIWLGFFLSLGIWLGLRRHLR